MYRKACHEVEVAQIMVVGGALALACALELSPASFPPPPSSRMNSVVHRSTYIIAHDRPSGNIQLGSESYA